MCYIYIVDYGVSLRTHENRIVVTKKDGEVFYYPIETVEGISIFSNAQISSQCIEACFDRNIRISYFASNGKYRGVSSSVNVDNGKRIIKQIEFCKNSDDSLNLCKSIIKAKIANQIVVARRHTDSSPFIKDNLLKMKRYYHKVDFANSKQIILGYEGLASRCYFEIMSYLIPKEYHFNGRKYPANDPVNALLSLGYSILTSEIHGQIVNNGLTAYIGFLHEEKDNHPTLASDLIEEWRAIIVDSVVLNIVLNKEIDADDFTYEKGRCYIDPNSMRILIRRLNEKMETPSKYLLYLERPVTYREGIWHQIHSFKNLIDHKGGAYQPVRIR